MKRGESLPKSFKGETKARAAVGLLIIVALAVGPLSLQRLRAQSGGERERFVKGEILVEIKEGASIDEVNSRNRTATIERLRGTNFYRLRIPEGRPEKRWRKRLERDPDVLLASLNPLVTTVFGRSVMSYPDGRPQLGHTEAEYLAQKQIIERLRLADSHLRSAGENVVVAVIDTGVDATHPALASHMWRDTSAGGDIPGDGRDNDNDGFRDDARGWDFVGNDPDPMDEPGDPATTVAGHGTFIAGLIALAAPAARIMPIRAFRPDGHSNVFYLAAAIKFAVDHGAQVINMSCGTTEDSRVLKDAIDYARGQGAILVAAVGNQGTSEAPQYPANYVEEVIGVGVVDENDVLTYYSNYGPGLSVVAYGDGVTSTFYGGGFARWSGTSFATPIVSAQAALILAADNDNTTTRQTVEETAITIEGLNPRYAGMLGKGRIDVLAALQSRLAKPVVDLYAAIALAPVNSESVAQGYAEIAVVDAIQLLRVTANNLTPHAAYRLTVDGNQIGTTSPTSDELVANEFGGLEVTLLNLPGGDNRLPEALDPVTGIRRVELRDARGDVVLQNDFRPVEDLAPQAEVMLKQARLAAPDAASRAVGVAQVLADEASAGLRIEVDRLASDGDYVVIADGLALVTAAARSGFIRVDFSSDESRGQHLPPALGPAIKIKRFEVRDWSGQLVLEGGFRIKDGDIGRRTPNRT